MLKSGLLLICMIVGSFSHLKSQSTLPSDSVHVFYSIEEAAKDPDKVIKLNLSKKKLTAFPLQILSFRHLQYLSLNTNRLTSVPSDIGKLEELETLDLSKNKIRELPPEIGDLKNLKHLILYQNDIDTIPPEIGQLKKLIVLDLWDNELSTLPGTIKNLVHLEILDLRGILFTERQLLFFKELLPEATIYSSPSCGTCKDP